MSQLRDETIANFQAIAWVDAQSAGAVMSQHSDETIANFQAITGVDDVMPSRCSHQTTTPLPLPPIPPLPPPTHIHTREYSIVESTGSIHVLWNARHE